MKCLLYICLSLLSIYPSSELQSSPDVALSVSPDTLSTESTLTSSTLASVLVSASSSPPLFNSSNFADGGGGGGDFDNLLNVTSELQLEKVNEDADCRRQLFISDKCLKRMIFLAKDSALPRTLDEASFYCR